MLLQHFLRFKKIARQVIPYLIQMWNERLLWFCHFELAQLVNLEATIHTEINVLSTKRSRLSGFTIPPAYRKCQGQAKLFHQQFLSRIRHISNSGVGNKKTKRNGTQQ